MRTIPSLHFSLPALAGVCLLLAGCATVQVASRWTPQSATGDEQPWYYLDDQAIIFATDNDSENLNLKIRFRTNETKWVRSCAMTGLTVWLDPTGHKKRDFGIRVAAGPEPERRGTPSQGDFRLSPDAARPGLMPPRDDGVYVIRPGETTAIAEDGSRGPRAEFTSENGVCTYDITVPLRTDVGRNLGLDVAPGTALFIGLTAGMDDDDRRARRAQRMERDDESGAREGPRPGGGQRPGGPPGGAEAAANPETWVNIRLARP